MRRRRPSSSPPTDSARAAGLRLLGRRELSRAELTARLLDRGYAPSDVDAAVSSLAGDRSVDDRRMAFAYVRTASRLKGRGRLRIQRELENRGISKDLAREALADIPADEDVRSIERFLARQRATTDADTPQGRRRLFQRLLRRGFPPDVIARILGHGVQ